MTQSILQELRSWRAKQARIEGVESYRVLPNACLDALAGVLPKTKEELLAIKGIKEAKYQKYGKVLLDIIRKYTNEPAQSQSDEHLFELPSLPEEINEPLSNDPLSVSQFLDGLNVELSGMAARIQGEVSSVDERERVIYFTIKDSRDESTLNCLIFRYQYDISGVHLVVGDEIIVEGVPEIYKPNGRLSLKVGVIELFGEGALKKAYEALKRKLEDEGLFAPERKRELPQFPERIALITSEQGAAIGDFTMNLGQQGFHVTFYPTSVEGKKAVFEIIEAIRFFNKHPEKYDLLVIIRGGGSLESLQAFNNEALVREVAHSQIITLCGIGHEKDVPLATLVCDKAVSTPTATARTLREPFEQARTKVQYIERSLLSLYEKELLMVKTQLENISQILLEYLGFFTKRFQMLSERFAQCLPHLQYSLKKKEHFLSRAKESLYKSFSLCSEGVKKQLQEFEETLRRYDPKRALALGYSLIMKEGKILRAVKDIQKGDVFTARLAQGRIDAEVKEVYNE